MKGQMQEESHARISLDPARKKTSMGKEALILTVSQVFVLLVSMVSAMLLSRFRTLQEYGTYAQILTVTNLTTSFLILGLPNSINYFLARAETSLERQKFLNTYYSLTTVLSAIIGLAMLLLTPIMGDFFRNPALKAFTFFLVVFPWARITMSSIEYALVVYHKTPLLAGYRLGHSFFVLTAIVLAKVLGWSFRDYMILFLAVEAGFAVSVYVIVSTQIDRLKCSIDKSLIGEIFRYSIPIGLGAALGTIQNEIDKLMIARFYSTEEVAIYANAGRDLPITIIVSAVTAVLLPRVVRLLKAKRNDEAIALWNTATEFSFLFIAFLCTGVIVFASEVMQILYSEKYLAGVSIFRIYSIGTAVRCTYFGLILNATGNTKAVLKASLYSVLLNIVLNYIMYKLIGFTGPAVATVISLVFAALYQLKMTSRQIKIPIRKLFPMIPVLVITLLNIGFGLVISLIQCVVPLEQFIGEIPEALVLTSIWVVVYYGLIFSNIKQKWTLLNEN